MKVNDSYGINYYCFCLNVLTVFFFFHVFQEIEGQIDRICEMGEVMRKAVQVDDDQFFKVQEKLAQLEVRTHVVAKDRSSFWRL